MSNVHPVVLVHGLFGWGPSELGGFQYWGTARHVESSGLPRLFASVGPISSMHDRACELAFQIKGGRVDYGAEHAAEFGHARYGRDHGAGLYPEWSADHPVHLVGHSMGGPTIWLLQQMLAADAFGWGSNADWIHSLSSISGVLNGSTATYFLGCDLRTGRVGALSAAAFLAAFVELTTAITGEVVDRFYDFDLHHWGLRREPGEPALPYLTRIATCPMFRGKDNGAYSLTIQAALELNERAAMNPRTFYFSYVTSQTFRGPLTNNYYPAPEMNPFMIPTSLYIAAARYLEPFYPGFDHREWHANDGLVSSYSQEYPRIGTGGSIAAATPFGGAPVSFQPGRWYSQPLDDMDHIDIVALPQLGQVGRQKRFYGDLFQRLAAL